MIRILVVVPYEELFEPIRRYLASVDTRDFIVELEHIVGPTAFRYGTRA